MRNKTDALLEEEYPSPKRGFFGEPIIEFEYPEDLNPKQHSNSHLVLKSNIFTLKNILFNNNQIKYIIQNKKSKHNDSLSFTFVADEPAATASICYLDNNLKVFAIMYNCNIPNCVSEDEQNYYIYDDLYYSRLGIPKHTSYKTTLDNMEVIISFSIDFNVVANMFPSKEIPHFIGDVFLNKNICNLNRDTVLSAISYNREYGKLLYKKYQKL